MADIAEIGFRAETGQLADAKVKLEAISPAAAKAEQASVKLARASTAAARAAQGQAAATLAAARASGEASRADIQAASAALQNARAATAAARADELKAAAAQKAAAASNAVAAAFAKEGAAATEAAGQVQRLNVAANQNARQMASAFGAMQATPGNIAAQFQDIGVTAAMGMNPLLIALQQGTQLSAAFTGPGGLRAIVPALMAIISPVALVTIGIVALVAAGLQMVDWIAVAQWGLNQIATILPQVAQGAAVVGAIFAIAFAPSIAASIWAIGTALIMGVMNGIIAIVATIGAIPILIGTVIAGFFIFRDEITQILGFDIVQAARDGANWLIGAIVGAVAAMKAAAGTLPAAFGDIAYQMANTFLQGISWMVREAITLINGLIAKMNGGLRSAASAVGLDPGSMVQIPDFGMPTIGLGGGIENPYAGAAAATGAAAAEAFNAAQGVDYVGAGLKVIQDGANAAAEAVRGLAGDLGALGEDGKGGKGKKAKGGGGKTEGEKFEDIVNGAERRIETLKAERDAIGMSEEATARLKYETEMLNQARQKGIDLTPAQREQIAALAGEMANLEASTKRAQDAFDFAKGLVKGFVSDLRNGLKNGEGFWDSFKNAAMNALDKIVDKLLNNVIDAIFQVNAAGASGGGGGFFGKLLGGIGSLFGLGGGAFPAAPSIGLWAKGGAFASGINGYSNSIVDRPTLFAFASGAGIMGEAGPEAIMPLQRGPDGSLGVQMYGGNGGGSSSVNNNVEVTNVYQISGAISREDIVQEIKNTADQTIETTKKSMVGWLNQYSQDGSFA